MRRATALVLVVIALCASFLLYAAWKPQEVEADYTHNITITEPNTFYTDLHKAGLVPCAGPERVWMKAVTGGCAGGGFEIAVDAWYGMDPKRIYWSHLGFSPTAGQTCCMYWKCLHSNPPPTYLWGNDHETIQEYIRPTATSPFRPTPTP